MDQSPRDGRPTIPADAHDAAKCPARKIPRNIVPQGRKIPRNIVPHGIEKREIVSIKLGRGNTFALLPQTPNQGSLTRGPSKCQPPPPHATWRPSRASAWTHVASCHVSAPLAPRVGHARPCHVASVPRRIRAGPARHISPMRHVSPWSCGNKTTFFAILIMKNHEKFNKNQIKNKKTKNFINS